MSASTLQFRHNFKEYSYSAVFQDDGKTLMGVLSDLRDREELNPPYSSAANGIGILI